MITYRTGRKNHRTIYVQAGAEPADTDEQVGTMDTPELGARVVGLLNAHERQVLADPVPRSPFGSQEPPRRGRT